MFILRHFSLSFSSLRDFFFFFFRSRRQSSGEREFLWSRSQTAGISTTTDKSMQERVSWFHTFPLGTTLAPYSPLLPPPLALSIVTSFSAVMASAVGVSRLWWAGPTPDGQTKKSSQLKYFRAFSILVSKHCQEEAAAFSLPAWGHLKPGLLLHFLLLLLSPLSAELLWVDVDDLSNHLQRSIEHWWIETSLKFGGDYG